MPPCCRHFRADAATPCRLPLPLLPDIFDTPLSRYADAAAISPRFSIRASLPPRPFSLYTPFTFSLSVLCDFARLLPPPAADRGIAAAALLAAIDFAIFA